MKFDPRYVALLGNIDRQFDGFDLVVGDTASRGNSEYISKHRHEYLRTIQDIDLLFDGSKGKRVFEIGAFFGVVSIALARLGYQVTASDVPEYMGLAVQRDRFSKEGVSVHEMNFSDYKIDAPDESFDCVIMCEVLEHLNFNPLPLFKEINRILSVDGVFYLALPNGAQIRNRINLALGRPIGLKVSEFFHQLDGQHELIANGHWREYTMSEVREMLEPMGFRREKSYYFSLGECEGDTRLKKRLGRMFYKTFPQFKENQVNVYRKDQRTQILFDIPKTVHPELGRL